MLKRIFSLLQYVSDLHLEKGFTRRIKPSKTILVLAGDIGYPKQMSYQNFLLNTSQDFDKVFVLSGNHEYDQEIVSNFHKVDERIENICAMRSNLFYLQKKSFSICTTYNIHLTGCTLWAHLPTSRFHLYLDHVKWLNSIPDENNHVIATHHCPFNIREDKVFKYFGSNQSHIIQKTNTLAWIYGHTHLNKNAVLHDKWIVTNQYGSYEKPLLGYKDY